MVIILATKKKFKLKKKFKRLILLSLILVFLGFTGKHLYNYIEYRSTQEYAFLDKGYTKETYELLTSKLSDQNLEYLQKEDKIDYIKDLVGQKYYIDSHLEEYLDYFNKNSKKSFEDVVAIVNVGAQNAWYSNATTTNTNDRYSILVNKFKMLPSNFDSGTIKTFSLTYAYGEVKAEEETYKAFIEMANSAKQDGYTLILTSGYRTHEYQSSLYENMKSQRGEEYADKYAARPGSSEHETGLSLDILTYGGLTDTFKDTETYKWLHTHAHEYGFIERYPEGKEYLTGYAAESWHYRYLGKELSKKVYDEGITYDEYYAFYLAR